jgi:chromosome segregation ATPase
MSAISQKRSKSLDLEDQKFSKPSSLSPGTLNQEEDVVRLWDMVMEARTLATQASKEAESARQELKRAQERSLQLEEECKFLKNTAELRQKDFTLLQELEAELNRRCSEQSGVLSDLQEAHSEMISRLTETDELLQMEKQKRHDISSQLDQVLRLYQGLKRRLKDKTKSCSNLSETVKFQTSEIKRLNEFEEINKHQRIEINQLQKTLEIREEQAQELTTRVLQLQRYEKRLENYLGNLNAQKIQLKQLAAHLAEEVEAARTIHPLKDYLSLTEFEIAKLELQLKKTPTSSPERPQLEECITQLSHQKEFLKSIISDSVQKLEEQALTIRQISQDPNLAPIPPSPPLPQNLQNPLRWRELEPSEA